MLRISTALKAFTIVLAANSGLALAQNFTPVPTPTTSGSRPDATAPQSASLKERLEVGLKARRPEEFAYIAAISKQVDEGVLELSLVDSTFLWARKKPKHEFFYFRQALEARRNRTIVASSKLPQTSTYRPGQISGIQIESSKNFRRRY